MSTHKPSLCIRSKVWIEDDSGRAIFGLGRLKILDGVYRCGSIQAAAKELGMSYRAVWGRIKTTETRLGQPLLVRNIGGAAGGGSQLTPFGLEFMRQFQKVQEGVLAESERLFKKSFAPVLRPARPPKK